MDAHFAGAVDLPEAVGESFADLADELVELRLPLLPQLVDTVLHFPELVLKAGDLLLKLVDLLLPMLELLDRARIAFVHQFQSGLL